jgi:hypothetical protein
MKISPSLILLFFPFFLTAQTIWHVNSASTAPSPNGLSWSSAFVDLHQALAAAQSGDEVWIAQGVYKPTSGNDRFVTFNLPSGVALYGGFDGTETQRDQRNWTVNPTILSGDIGAPGDSTDNSYGIIHALNTNGLTRIDGLTIEEANANNDDIFIPYNSPTRSGGGIYLDGKGQGNSASLLLQNCIFRKNRAAYAGGSIFADGRNDGKSLISVNDCSFQHNKAPYGAGFAVENNTDQSKPLEVSGCVFHGNQGAAAWMNTYQEITFSDCSFSKNIQPGDGTVRIEGENKSHPIAFLRCDFIENSPNNSGVLSIYFKNSLKKIPLKISHCRFYGNLGFTAFIFGGTNSNGKFQVTVGNCIFHLNYSMSPNFNLNGFAAEDKAVFANCLFWKNDAAIIHRSPLGSQPTHIANSIIISDQPNGIIYGDTYLEHSIISKPECGQIGPNTTCGTNNFFAADPLFINANPTADADFRLQPCSPAVNAGDNAILDSLGITTDFDGNPRVRHGQADIGPYETNLFSVADISEPSCFGSNNGAVEFEANLCPPFTIEWPGGTLSGTVLTGLPAGSHVFTVTDANGLSFQETVLLNEPPPLQIIFTVQNASGPNAADGAILIDTVLGGTGAPTPADLTGLLPGTYTVTVTDANGCTALETISVGYTVKTSEPTSNFGAKIYPNPAKSGEPVFVEIAENEGGMLSIFDFQGKLLKETKYPPDTVFQLTGIFPAGIYRIEIHSETGKRAALRWVIY